METRAQLGAIPRTAIVLVTLGLLLVLFAAIAVGSGGSPPPQLPAPFGPAGNGLIAYGTSGDVWVMDQRGEHRLQLTSGSDLDYTGVWSPDGTWLAYWSLAFAGDPTDSDAITAAAAGPNVSIKLVRADGTGQRTLVSGLVWASDCGSDLSWSPDGGSIAYAQEHLDGLARDNQVWIAPVSDGEPRLVVHDGITPTWSPDGQTIAFARDLYTDAFGNRTFGRGIWLVPASGGDATRLTQRPGSGCAFNEPQWSADGTKIAFYAGPDGTHDVWVINADGSGETALATDAADEYWPRWSPDDSRIAFDRVVIASANAPQFVVMDPDGGNQVMLDHPLVASRYPTWSPDGTLLLGMSTTTDLQDTSGLMLIDVAGVQAPVTFETGHLWGDPAWQRVALPSE